MKDNFLNEIYIKSTRNAAIAHLRKKKMMINLNLCDRDLATEEALFFWAKYKKLHKIERTYNAVIRLIDHNKLRHR